MKFLGYAIAVVVAAGAITFAGQREAHGELVFDEDLNGPAPEAAKVQPAETRATERQDMTKAEMLRRQRLREEMKNEDILTQKLEELRLKEEMKLTDRLLGSGTDKTETVAAVPVNTALPEQRVGSAVADPVAQPSVTSTAPVPATIVAPATGMVAAAPLTNTTTTTAVVSPDGENEPINRVTITPRVGTASITNSIYDVTAKFAVGGTVAVDVTDHIAFSGSYNYSSYNLGAGGSVMMPQGYGYGLQQLVLNDNEFDAGLRGYFLGLKSMVRPYVGAGLGYRKGYINFDDQTQAMRRAYDPYGSQDVDISGFTGFLETGMDFRISKGIALTGSFRYFNILSARQSIPLSASAFANPYGGYYYGGGYQTFGYDNRVDASNALAKNNFYQLMAGVSVSF